MKALWMTKRDKAFSMRARTPVSLCGPFISVCRQDLAPTIHSSPPGHKTTRRRLHRLTGACKPSMEGKSDCRPCTSKGGLQTEPRRRPAVGGTPRQCSPRTYYKPPPDVCLRRCGTGTERSGLVGTFRRDLTGSAPLAL